MMSGSGECAHGFDARLYPVDTLVAPSDLPDRQTCEQARRSRDARFDGLFFTAVKTTGIYCRPVCPAPSPREGNVAYYASAAAAESAGFRPCLRCRPELAPGVGAPDGGDAAVGRALKLIESGLLNDHPLPVLAGRLGFGERQLRRVFLARLGATPVQVHATRRLLFAKQLLSESRMRITDVALASGFRSLRRFNDAFRHAYKMAPSALRRQSRGAPEEGNDALVLRLAYRPPYDFAALLEFLRARALPGLEQVDAHSYARTFGAPERTGWLRVSRWGDGADALRLELHGAAPSDLLGWVARVRRMFDLDADPLAIASILERDPSLRPLVRQAPGLRLPGAWDGFETAIRAVLGQQVSVAAARTLAVRLLQRFGQPVPRPGTPALTLLFPGEADLDGAAFDGLGLTRTRGQTIRELVRAVRCGQVDFSPAHTLEDHVARWTALPGIGPWTAQYIAMRAQSHPDAFPAADLVLRRSIAGHGTVSGTRALSQRAEAWRPWRAYAAIHLWRADTILRRRT